MSDLMRWWQLGMDTWRLGGEASEVIGRRGTLFATGGSKALLEANLMISEKVAAALELQMALMIGSLGRSPRVVSHAIVKDYRGRVRRNAARLRA